MEKIFKCQCGESNEINFYPYRKNKCKRCVTKQVSTRYHNLTLDEKTNYQSGHKDWVTNNILNYRLVSARNRAKYKNLEFNITLNDLEELFKTQNNICPYSGLELTHSYDGNKFNTISLDRIDSNKGYTKDNIQIISSLVNEMKNSLDNNDFLHMIKKIYEYRVL
jgi:hypothetical protein